MKNLVKISFLLLILCFSINAQTEDKASISKNWTQIESKEKDFSIKFPNDYSAFVDKKWEITISYKPRSLNFINIQQLRSITGFQDDVSMWMESYDVKNGKKAFSAFLNYIGKRTKKIKDFKYQNFEMREATFNGAKFHKVYYFYSKKKLILVGAASNKPDSSVLKNFLGSINVYGKPLFKNIASNIAEISSQKLVLDKLNSTPLEIVNSEKDYNSEEEKNPSEAEIKKPNETKMTLLYIPKLESTPEARLERVKAEAQLEIEFGKNGQIQKIDILKGLKFGLTEQALSLARRIRFLPQMKDGIPINRTRKLKVSFSNN